MSKTVRVYETIVDGPEDGPLGPAGDGSFVHRFRTKKAAEAFIVGKTRHGREPSIHAADVSRKLAQRWGLA